MDLKDVEDCFSAKSNLSDGRGLHNAPAPLERLVGKVGQTMPAEGLEWPQPFRTSAVLWLFMGAY